MTAISTTNVFFFIVKVYCFVNLNTYVEAKDLPLLLRNLKCPKTKEFDLCFVKNGNKAIPLIAKGDPEYGIPNMAPLKTPFRNLIDTQTLHVNLTDIEVYGLDKMKIVSQKTDFKRNIFETNLIGDNITMVGQYKAEGNILIMPVKGSGGFSLYFKNGKYKAINKLTVIKKNGEKYFKPMNSFFSSKFDRIIFNLENLFEGDKQLGKQVNAFLNENWKTLAIDFGPSVEKTVAELMSGIFDNITSVVPIKNCFI